MKKVILVIFIHFLFSCASDKSSYHQLTYDEFLTHEIIYLEDLGSPVRIKIDSENRLIYLLQRNGSDLLRVYDLGTYDFVNSFVKKGEGPNEQMIGWKLQLDLKNRLIYSTDPIKKRLFGYSLDSVLSGKPSFWPTKIVDLRKHNPDRPLVIDDDLIIDFRKNYQSNDGFAYDLIDFNGELLNAFGGFPTSGTTIDNFQQSAAFAGKLAISDDQKYLIRAYFYTDRLEKLDLDGNILKAYHGPFKFDPDFITDDLGAGTSRVVPRAGSLLAYKTEAAIHRDDIYILFDGKEFYRDDEETDCLLHFDKDLNLKKVFRLDQRLSNFDIDWKTNVLYGYSRDVEGGIVKYTLK